MLLRMHVILLTHLIHRIGYRKHYGYWHLEKLIRKKSLYVNQMKYYVKFRQKKIKTIVQVLLCVEGNT